MLRKLTVFAAGLMLVMAACGGRQVSNIDEEIVIPDYGDATGDQGNVGDKGGVDQGGVDHGGWDDLPTDVPPSVNAIGPIQQSDASVKCPADGSDTDPQFQNGVRGVSLDVVIVSPRWVVTKSKEDGTPTKYGYYVADANMVVAERWRGAMMVVPAELSDEEYQLGDILTIKADHADYYCNTQLSVKELVHIGTGIIPKPLVINPAELGTQDPETAEPLEGVLVQVRDVVVTEVPFLGSDGKDHGGFYIDDDMVVANDFRLAYMAKATDARKVGHRFKSITGVVNYTYGKYALMPRFDEDLVPEEDGEDKDIIDEDVTGTDDGPDGDNEPVNAIGPIQQSDISVKCPPDGETADPAFRNGERNLNLDVVVTSPRWVAQGTKADPKMWGYMVADAGMTTAEAWRGITMVVPIEVTTDELALGDVVRVNAEHVDYYCNSQIKVKSLTFVRSGNVPEPLIIDPDEIGSQNPETAEPLEGVLVKVENVTVITTPFLGSDGKDHGGFVVTGEMPVVNDFGLAYMSKNTDSRTVGDEFESITGVVKYTFGKYVLAPRFDADMVKKGGSEQDPGGEEDPGDNGDDEDSGDDEDPPIFQIQTSTASKDCTANEIQTITENLTIENLVVVTPKFSATQVNDGYYVVDAASVENPVWSGVMIMIPKSLATDFALSDVIKLTGAKHIEYYCFTVVQATGASKTGTSQLPQPIDIGATIVNAWATSSSELEQYEGNIIRLSNVQVTHADSSDNKGWFRVANNIEVLSDFFYPEDTRPYTPTVGDTFTSLTGALKYHWGKFRIAPTVAADFNKAP
ncbi:MAG TPA: hypothetical protein PLN07_11865 [Myxococcota bacterium]|nr:hypothetical protein [Myxococcota bacterium]